MVRGELRQRLNSGDLVVGTFQILDSPMVSEIIGLAGFEFVVIDQEHGPLTAETTLSLCLGAERGGASPVVRVRKNAEAEIQRALDVGAAGVAVPQVETVADAKRAAFAARFQPIGNRGLNQYVRASRYGGGEQYTEQQNREVTVIIHIEGERGVANVDDIAEVEGIDVLFLGPYDLSQSLGIPGEVRNKRVEALMEEVVERASEADTVVGTYADDVETAHRWIDAGVQFVAVSEAAPRLLWSLEELCDGIER